MTSKCETFFNKLDSVVAGLDTDKVKSAIGDSINNNRTLTVNQVVRYLTTRRDRELRNLGSTLGTLNLNLGSSIVSSRTSLRSDALDINEFLNAFSSNIIHGDLSVRQGISSLIA